MAPRPAKPPLCGFIRRRHASHQRRVETSTPSLCSCRRRRSWAAGCDVGTAASMVPRSPGGLPPCLLTTRLESPATCMSRAVGATDMARARAAGYARPGPSPRATGAELASNSPGSDASACLPTSRQRCCHGAREPWAYSILCCPDAAAHRLVAMHCLAMTTARRPTAD
eukprot:365725-Chlamydomonas_euryale.AAC.28